MAQNRTLYILNGMVMYEYFKRTHLFQGDLMIPFNEAMCYGNTCENIFSDELINIRSHVHNVTPAQYDEIVLKPLNSLFSQKFNHIVLLFDADMFCQINLLTILAWLDQNDYDGKIDLHIVDDHYQLTEHFSLEASKYDERYKQVLIYKRAAQDVHPLHLKNGIELYLNCLQIDSDLMLFIKKHQDIPITKLITLLIKNFRNYGLGDSQ